VLIKTVRVIWLGKMAILAKIYITESTSFKIDFVSTKLKYVYQMLTTGWSEFDC